MTLSIAPKISQLLPQNISDLQHISDLQLAIAPYLDPRTIIAFVSAFSVSGLTEQKITKQCMADLKKDWKTLARAFPRLLLPELSASATLQEMDTAIRELKRNLYPYLSDYPSIKAATLSLRRTDVKIALIAMQELTDQINTALNSSDLLECTQGLLRENLIAEAINFYNTRLLLLIRVQDDERRIEIVQKLLDAAIQHNDPLLLERAVPLAMHLYHIRRDSSYLITIGLHLTQHCGRPVDDFLGQFQEEPELLELLQKKLLQDPFSKYLNGDFTLQRAIDMAWKMPVPLFEEAVDSIYQALIKRENWEQELTAFINLSNINSSNPAKQQNAIRQLINSVIFNLGSNKNCDQVEGIVTVFTELRRKESWIIQEFIRACQKNNERPEKTQVWISKLAPKDRKGLEGSPSKGSSLTRFLFWCS